VVSIGAFILSLLVLLSSSSSPQGNNKDSIPGMPLESADRGLGEPIKVEKKEVSVFLLTELLYLDFVIFSPFNKLRTNWLHQFISFFLSFF
jgi:hypothetical protein